MTQSRLPAILTPNSVGSIGGLNIYPIKVAPKQGAVVLIYCRGGIGKTSTAASMLDSEYCNKGLILDAGGNPEVLAHRSDCDFVQLPTWDATEKIWQGIANGEARDYDLIVTDHLTELVDMRRRDLFGDESKNYDDQTSQRQWGIITRGVLGLIRAGRDIARRDGTNVVFTALEMAHPKKEYFNTLAMNPALFDRIPGVVPFVCYLDGDEKTQERIAHFELSNKHLGKWQCAPTQAAYTVPRTFSVNLKDGPHFGNIVDVIKGEKPWPFKMK